MKQYHPFNNKCLDKWFVTFYSSTHEMIIFHHLQIQSDQHLDPFQTFVNHPQTSLLIKWAGPAETGNWFQRKLNYFQSQKGSGKEHCNSPRRVVIIENKRSMITAKLAGNCKGLYVGVNEYEMHQFFEICSINTLIRGLEDCC